jgi:hypothetical protein
MKVAYLVKTNNLIQIGNHYFVWNQVKSGKIAPAKSGARMRGKQRGEVGFGGAPHRRVILWSPQ